MNHRLSTAIRIADAAQGVLRRTQSLLDVDFVPIDERGSGHGHLGVEPMLLALSMELALKAWYVFDHDVPKAQWGHDLAKLFDALVPTSQHRLENEFRRSVAPMHPQVLYVDYGIRDLLYHHKNAFVDWRYLHERRKPVSFDVSAFEATLEMVLAEFRKRYRTERVAPSTRV